MEPLTPTEAHIWELATPLERVKNAGNPRLWVLNKMVNLGELARARLMEFGG